MAKTSAPKGFILDYLSIDDGEGGWERLRQGVPSGNRQGAADAERFKLLQDELSRHQAAMTALIQDHATVLFQIEDLYRMRMGDE
jgi:hypothetical protein